MQEMIKLPDGAWTYSASSSEIVDLNVDLPDNTAIENVTHEYPPWKQTTEKPRRKTKERKAKP